MSCPIGYYTPSRDEPVRHCIDFSGVPDNVRINLNNTMNFREFKYNDKRKRISFLTQRLSFCVSLDRSKVISSDPQCKEFDTLFFTLNPHIPKASLLIYEFFDTGDERYSWSELHNFIKFKFLNEIGGSVMDSTKILIYGASLILLYRIFSNTSSSKAETSKEKKNGG